MTGSLASVHPELIPEWSEKNLPLTPDMAIHHLHHFLHQTAFLLSRNKWEWCKEVE